MEPGDLYFRNKMFWGVPHLEHTTKADLVTLTLKMRVCAACNLLRASPALWVSSLDPPLRGEKASESGAQEEGQCGDPLTNVPGESASDFSSHMPGFQETTRYYKLLVTNTLLYKTNSNMGLKVKKSLSPVQLFATPWTAARQASLSITNSRSHREEDFKSAVRQGIYKLEVPPSGGNEELPRPYTATRHLLGEETFNQKRKERKKIIM